MKCESNRIGKWLDDIRLRSSNMDDEKNWGPTDWMSYYDGAVKCLEVAGFKVDAVPCGRGAIHVVRPPDRVVVDDADDSQMKLEV